ncbi:MAG: T9SS type A sorting domain-containing protein [Bacteroidales bacterium]|jgi:hypothetical protein|nr:T9SS type A sorting domain-containing protein [Bacteroidales bacterium]
MKKFLFTVAFALTFVALSAQQFPNSGFETWSGGNPTGWKDLTLSAPVVGTVSVGVNTITQATPAHGGNYALNAKASPLSPAIQAGATLFGLDPSLLSMSAPGMVTNGTVDAASVISLLTLFSGGGEIDIEALVPTLANAMTGGMSITQFNRPLSVSGYAKAAVQGGEDICALVAIVYSNTGGTRSMIGFGAAIPSSSNSYQPFSCDIAYTDDTKIANELIFMAVAYSRLPAAELSDNPTNITIDDLSISHTVGVDVVSTPLSMVYPNPTHDIVKISVENPAAPYQITVSDMLGRVVMSEVSKSEINLSTFEKGIYLVKVSQNGKENVQKIVLE